MSEQICYRCRRPLGQTWTAFFDRKFHQSCHVMFLVLYRDLRGPRALDQVRVRDIPKLLWYAQPYDPGIDADNPPKS